MYCANNEIPKLNESNYTSWAVRIKSFLTVQGLEECLESAEFITKNESNKMLDKKAKALIVLNVDDKNLSLIEESLTAYEMWEKLMTAHTKMDGYHALLTLKDYVNNKKRYDEPITDYIYNKIQLYKKLTKYGLKLDDKIQIGVILIGLPTEYEAAIRTINLNDQNLTIENVKVKLTDEERLINQKYNDNNVNVLTAQKINNDKKNLNRDKYDSDRKCFDERNNYGNRRESFKFKEIKCYRCNKFGNHLGRDCPEFGDHIKQGKYSRKPGIRYLDHDDKSGQRTNVCVRRVSDSSNKFSIVNKNEWIIDSGCTDHMTNDLKKFNKINKRDSNVVCANGDILKSEGSGDLNLNLNNSDEPIQLQNVLYIPELSGNLLSVSKLCEKFETVKFNQENAQIIDKRGITVAEGKRRNEGYILSETSQQTNYVYERKTDVDIWHSRMGHPGIKETENIFNEYGIKGKTENETCETCNVSNIKRLKFPKNSTNRRSEVLELVHSDIMGPISPMSRGGNRFVITFTDDYSRYSEVYFIKNKYEALSKFKEYLNFVERKHGKKIKVLRSDNGGEYVSTEFTRYIKERGIGRELTSPGSPQQNGVAERLNQTLMNITRTLMEESGADLDLWGEALQTACYIKNRRPTTANDGLTPYERWHGRKAKINHMRKFGCKCWYLDRHTKRKYEPKGRVGIFTGYDLEAKAYRIWDQEKRKTIVSRDVRFAENIMPMKENGKGREEVTWRRLINILQTDEEDAYEGDTTIKTGGTKIIDETDRKQTTNERNEINTEIETDNQEIESENLQEHELITNTERTEQDERRNEPDTVRRTKSGRIVKTPKKFEDFEMGFTATKTNNEPRTFNEAVGCNEREEWLNAIDEELTNLANNDTWTIIEKPKNVRTIKTNWIFRKKKNERGEVVRFKARLVALGNKQIHNLDYDKTYSPVVMRKTMRIILAISAEKNWNVEHIDIDAAYLNAKLPEDIYLELPEGYDCNGLDRKKYVCKLNRSLYGLHQSGMLWNEELNNFLIGVGMIRSVADPCVYFNKERTLIISIYVDDIALHGQKTEIQKLKNLFSTRFSIKDLGEARKLLSLNIRKTNDGFTIDQTDYTNDLLKKYGMDQAREAITPLETGTKLLRNDNTNVNEDLRLKYQQAIGSLLYLATNTRPDISYSVTYLSQFNSNPTDEHWKSVKRILRYLKKTKDYGITYTRTGGVIDIYSDSDWGSDVTDRKSFSGYVLKMAGGAVCWSSRKQRCVALSTAEAEFTALCEGSKEVQWFTFLLNELSFQGKSPYIIQMDNMAAITIAENHITSERSKHIELKLFKIRDDIRNGLFKLKYVETAKNLADIFTKAMTADRHGSLTTALGIGSIREALMLPIQEEC